MNYSYTIRIARNGLFTINQSIIMGIINATPDSFYSPSRTLADSEIRASARKLIADGATIIDIGGYSTRPYASDASPVSPQEETDRLCSAIQSVRSECPNVIISADTFRASVARSAVLAGADIINDVSGASLDPDIISVAASLSVPYILTYNSAPLATNNNITFPTNTMSSPSTHTLLHTPAPSSDILEDTTLFFSNRIAHLRRSGISDIIIDPGFGFGKSMEQNYTLLRHLSSLSIFNYPILVALSRKRMAYLPTHRTPESSLFATTALHTLALSHTPTNPHPHHNIPLILRVHDPAPALDSIRITQCYNNQ